MKVTFELINKGNLIIGQATLDIPEMHPISLRKAMKQILEDYTEAAAIHYEFNHNGITVKETVEKLFNELA